MAENVQKIEIVNDSRSGLGTASMVLGIISIVGCWIPYVNIFSIILGFVGIALAIPALIVFIKKRKGSIGKVIAGIVLCIIALFIGFNINAIANKAIDEGIEDFNSTLDEMSGDKTNEILANDIEVVFGQYTTDGNAYYESGKLEVIVNNKLSTIQSYTIKVEALDKDGIRISTDTIYATSLGANQSGKYDAFVLDSVTTLKQATEFKVYEVSKY